MQVTCNESEDDSIAKMGKILPPKAFELGSFNMEMQPDDYFSAKEDELWHKKLESMNSNTMAPKQHAFLTPRVQQSPI